MIISFILKTLRYRGQASAAHGRDPRAGDNNNEGHNPPSTSMVSKLIAARRTESPLSFKDLECTDGPRGTKAGQHVLSAHSQRHTPNVIRKLLLDRTSNHPEAMDVKVVLPFVRTHASIIAVSAPNAAMTFTGIPSDSGQPWPTRSSASTPSYDSASLCPATTTNRLARMAASTRRPMSPSRCGTATIR